MTGTACCWCGGTWLAYALTSNNYSGLCCSVRWFVPLLAPAYYVLGVYLRDTPARRRDFVVLSAWGALLGVFLWHQGPWVRRFIPYAWFWPLVGAALSSWLACALWYWPRSTPSPAKSVQRKAA